jgi:hypothetical protein
LKLFQEWGKQGEIKENDGEGEFKYDIVDVRTFVNVTMYPQHNNKKNKAHISKNR